MVWKRKKAEAKDEAAAESAPTAMERIFTNKNPDGTPAEIGRRFEVPIVLHSGKSFSAARCPTCGTAFAGAVCAVDGTRAEG